MSYFHSFNCGFNSIQVITKFSFLFNFSDLFFDWIKFILVFFILDLGDFVIEKLEIFLDLDEVSLDFRKVVLSLFLFFHESLNTGCVFKQEIQLILCHLSNLRDFALLYDVVWTSIRQAKTFNEIFVLSSVFGLVVYPQVFVGVVSPRLGDFVLLVSLWLLTKINLDQYFRIFGLGTSLTCKINRT